ncbi:MAG TPA: hypothetical protein ENK63_05590 [Rhodobacterales bacterium]|nr:hypothetical protein [Rhodobacterales bacterium]
MKRLAPTLLLLAAVLVSLAGAVWPERNPLLAPAERQARDIALASGASYVSLRAINAALSVAQDIEVGASVVASGNVQPLKWLEPVDDTVERISAMIFAVAVFAGLLSVALGPVSAVGAAVLAVGLIGVAASRLWPTRHGEIPLGLRRLFAASVQTGVILALGVPVLLALGTWAGAWLTRTPVAEANVTLNLIADQAQALIGQPGASGAAPGWRDTLSAYLQGVGVFWDEADALLGAAVTLVASFFLRMVVMPLLLLVVFRQLIRASLGGTS